MSGRASNYYQNMVASQPLTVADLFCGAGGLSEGFRQAGYRIVAGNDVDPDACATYASNFREAVTVWGDVREPEVRERLLHAAHGARVIVGGPPCQAYSQVRNHARIIDDPRNAMYREFVRAVGTLRPLAFLMENVQGLEQMGVKEQVVQDLSLDGEYRVSVQLHDAADFGVPQTRKRLLFLGVHYALGTPPPVLEGTGATQALSLVRVNGTVPVHYRLISRRGASMAPLFTESYPVDSWLQRLRDPADISVVSAEQAIGDLAFLHAGTRHDERSPTELPPCQSEYQVRMRQDLDHTVTNVSVPKINRDTLIRLRGIPPGGNYRDLPDTLTGRYLTGERWGRHNGTGRLSRRHYYAYRRLHPDIWSWTLNTKADAVYHYAEPRALAVREFARLQSFPDRFVFTTDPRSGALPGRIDGGAAHSRYRQAGNAVPPLLARAAAEALRDCILMHVRIGEAAVVA